MPSMSSNTGGRRVVSSIFEDEIAESDLSEGRRKERPDSHLKAARRDGEGETTVGCSGRPTRSDLLSVPNQHFGSV